MFFPTRPVTSDNPSELNAGGATRQAPPLDDPSGRGVRAHGVAAQIVVDNATPPRGTRARGFIMYVRGAPRQWACTARQRRIPFGQRRIPFGQRGYRSRITMCD